MITANNAEHALVPYKPRKRFVSALRTKWRKLDSLLDRKLAGDLRVILFFSMVCSFGLMTGGFYGSAKDVSLSLHTGASFGLLFCFPLFLSGFTVFGRLDAVAFLLMISFLYGTSIGAANFSVFTGFVSPAIFLLSFFLDFLLCVQCFLLSRDAYRSLKRAIRSRLFVPALILFVFDFFFHHVVQNFL